MNFCKCSKCGKYALMENSICKSCYGKHILKMAWYFQMGKIKIPEYTDLAKELKEYYL